MADFMQELSYAGSPYQGKANLAKMDPEFMTAFESMAHDYFAQTGRELKINDGWRSQETQAQAYRNKPNLAAPPGYSLHETGKAIDIDTLQAERLAKMGLLDKYGFERPMLGKGKSGKNEPWHIQLRDLERETGARAATVSPDFMSELGSIGGSDFGKELDQVQPQAPPNGAQAQPQEKLSMGQEIAGAVAPYARPILEFGGLTLGGLAVTPETFGLGSALGAGLGYAAGKRAADTLESYAGKKKPQTLAETSLETGKDVALGAGMQLGGQAIGKISEGLMTRLANWAPRIYESALKIPPSVPEGIREKAVQTGIEGGYLPSKKGLERLSGEIDNLNRQIANVVDRSTKSAGKSIDSAKVASRIDDLKQFYQNAPPHLRQEFMDQLTEIQQMMAKEGVLTASEAQAMKQTIYRIHRKHYSEMKSLAIEADKAIARGLKEELVQQFPELAGLNAKDSALINLETIMERSVHRIRNYDVIRMGDVIAAAAGAGVHGGPGAAVGYLTKRILEAPMVKARLAFALSKAAATGGEQTLMGQGVKAIPYAASSPNKTQGSEGY